jgi:hypothetical protein
MNTPAPDLSLSRIDPQFRPVWEGRPPDEQKALGLYFLPHRSSRAMLTPTRPRIIKWYSRAKIVRPRYGRMLPVMQNLLQVYRALAAPARPVWRGGSWRLPHTVAEEHVTAQFGEIDKRAGVAARFCMKNLLETS